MHPLAVAGLIVAGHTAALLLGALALHAIPRLGAPGRALSAWLCRAPGLDLMITYFTALPLATGPIAGAILLRDAAGGAIWWGPWAGLAAAIAGQVLTVMLWTVAHELIHRNEIRGPRIVTQINRTVGPVRNHLAVWTTALAVPLFWFIRFAEYVVYAPLPALVRFPRYNAADWVNVSRHKFEGLVGHDRIWCLYCDWMTGVWALGSEMLRNVESFWCPLRFRSDAKCENCKVDFPDVAGGWVPFNAGMDAVVRTLEQQYPGPKGTNAWFGHPVRLTVAGSQVEAKPHAPAHAGRER